MLVSALMVLFAMKEATHMPDQITREQRHDLRSETLGRLTEIREDSALALQNDEYDIVRELRPEYGALTDALDRLGWQEVADPLVRTFDWLAQFCAPLLDARPREAVRTATTTVPGA